VIAKIDRDKSGYYYILVKAETAAEALALKATVEDGGEVVVDLDYEGEAVEVDFVNDERVN
jgi:hypothetical protein